MCLEDIRIQRKTTSGENTVLLDTTPRVFIPASLERTALVIAAPETNDIIVSMFSDPSATKGMRIQAGGNPLHMSLMTHGDIVRKQFWARTIAETESVAYWESSFTDNGK